MSPKTIINSHAITLLYTQAHHIISKLSFFKKAFTNTTPSFPPCSIQIIQDASQQQIHYTSPTINLFEMSFILQNLESLFSNCRAPLSRYTHRNKDKRLNDMNEDEAVSGEPVKGMVLQLHCGVFRQHNTKHHPRTSNLKSKL